MIIATDLNKINVQQENNRSNQRIKVKLAIKISAKAHRGFDGTDYQKKWSFVNFWGSVI